MKIKVITLFNTGRYYTRDKKNNHLDLDYSNTRLKLFQETCLPSLLNQSNNNFEWNIFTDFDHPHFLKFKELCNQHNNCIFHDIRFFEHNQKEVEGYFQSLLNNDVGDIAELKLDSDDSISKDFIQIVSNLPKSYYEVYYPDKMFVYKNNQLYKNFDPRKNFPIIIKCNNNENNLYERNHNDYYHISKSLSNLFYVYTRHTVNHWKDDAILNADFIKAITFTKDEQKYITNQIPWIKTQWTKTV